MAISIPLACGCVLRHTVQELPHVTESYSGAEGDSFLTWARTVQSYWFKHHAAHHRCPEPE